MSDGKESPPGGTVDSKLDGFRKPKRRGKGWRERALKAGEIAEKPQPEQTYGDDVTVIDVPAGTLSGGGKEIG